MADYNSQKGLKGKAGLFQGQAERGSGFLALKSRRLPWLARRGAERLAGGRRPEKDRIHPLWSAMVLVPEIPVAPCSHSAGSTCACKFLPKGRS